MPRFIQFAIQWSSIAFLYYDYLLTLGMEVKYIWGQRFKVSTILYILCRYALISNVVYLVTIANKLHTSCDTGYKVVSALSVLGRFAIIVVWSTRTYAVFGKSRIVLAYFVVVGSCCVVADVLHVSSLQCAKENSKSSAYSVIIDKSLCILILILEISSAGLTTIRVIQAMNAQGDREDQKKTLMYLLLEQGVLYFCAATALTMVALILNFRVSGGFFQKLLNAFTLPVSCVLTARFLLHLRRWEAKATGAESDNERVTRLEFAARDDGTSRMRSTDSFMSLDFGDDPLQQALGREQGADLEAALDESSGN